MTPAIDFLVDFFRDVDRMAAWLDAVSPGRGEDFRLRLADLIDQVAAAPLRFAEFAEGLRVAMVARDNALDFFKPTASGVLLVALRHAASGPSQRRR